MKNKLHEDRMESLLVSKGGEEKSRQNFGLQETEFEEMVHKMKNGDDVLFEKMFLAQFEDCIKYLMNRYRVNRSQAYDASMEALLKFRKRLLIGKITYGNMRFLFTRMASQFLSGTTKHKTFMLEDYKEEPEEENVNEEVLDALDRSWKHLCDDCRNLLSLFYYQKIALKTLANKYGKSESATRKQKQRCLEKLRMYFLKFYQE